jgi:adenylylsulfate kinase
MIIWLTGQPGSGKTTICKEISELKDHRIFHIDCDDLRNLFENKDYSEQGRRKNIELAQQIAEFLNNKGKDVLVSLVSPYKDQRDKFKEKMGDNLVEIYVHTSQTRGREDYFVKEYVQPTEKYLDLDTTNESIEVSAKKVLYYVKK